MFVDVLPCWERCTYFVLGVYSIAHMMVALFLEGEKYRDILVDKFSPGWTWLGRHQDDSDDKWSYWRESIQKFLFLNAIHVLLSQICFYFRAGEKLHSRVLLIYDVAAACTYLNIRIVVLQFILALTMYATSLLGSISLVWLVEVAMISSLNYDVLYYIQAKYLKLLNYDQEHRFSVTISFFYIHLLSFSVEKIRYRKSKAAQENSKTQKHKIGQCEQKEILRSSGSNTETIDARLTDTCQQQKTCQESCDPSGTCCSIRLETLDCDPSLLDLLFYSFYLPTLFDGPILIYRDFHAQVKASFTSSSFTPDVYDIAKKMLKLALWAFFIDFQFHVLSYSALSLHPDLIAKMPVWAVAAIAYFHAQIFMVKYVVLYGLPIQLARFDGLIPLATPRCISWVYSMTDMWKHFDVGLYNFIKTYIYIPLGGSRSGLLRQIFASGVVFLFIYFWHGARDEMILWCFGNFLMGLLEVMVRLMEQSAVGIKLKSHIGPPMCLRIKAIFIFPVYFSSFLQVLYSFVQKDEEWIFVSTLVTKATWTTLLTEFVFITAYIHNAIYIAQRYKYKDKEKRDDETEIN